MVATFALFLTGCSGGGSTSSQPPAPVASSSAAGESAVVLPEPGRTIEVEPVSAPTEWTGLRLAVVVPVGSPSADRLRKAVSDAASARGASVEEIVAAAPGIDALGAAFEAAVATDPDLVVGLGGAASDVFGFETPKHLDRQFLIVGAQVAEPTANVTAVIWEGATSRGSSAAADGALEDDASTLSRGEEALAAGVESVRAGITGVVLHLGDG